MKNIKSYIVAMMILILATGLIASSFGEVQCVTYFNQDTGTAEAAKKAFQGTRPVKIVNGQVVDYYTGEPIVSSTSSTPSHTHDYEQTVTKEATCSEEGVMTYTCSGCGNSYTKAIPKTEHSWNETITKPATCTEEGIMHKVCSVCGYEEDETIPVDPEAHDYEEVITKEPTCTESGIKTFTCRNCGDSYTEEIPALGHDETSEYVYKAKIGKLIFDGKTVYTCSRCGEVREEADPSTYPILYLYLAIMAVLVIIAIPIVIIAVAAKRKKVDKTE